MGLHKQWDDLIQQMGDTAVNQAFWLEYYDMEKKAYAAALSKNQAVWYGKVTDIAGELGLEPVLFAGFCDGINSSLTQELDLDAIEEDGEIEFTIDWEKLLYNMHNARAKWLYDLPEWQGVLEEDKRKEIAQKWRDEHIVRAEKKAGRNDPCPCGSGKKFKHCCG